MVGNSREIQEYVETPNCTHPWSARQPGSASRGDWNVRHTRVAGARVGRRRGGAQTLTSGRIES